MAIKKELLYKKFGKLTVIEQTDERDVSGSIIWLCRCDDGNFKKVSSRSLVSGDTKSCGCLWSENLIGKKYGKLTVINKSDVRPRDVDGQFWMCQCICGGNKDVLSEHLINGDVKSCGCEWHLSGDQSPLWTGYGDISGQFWSSIRNSAIKRGISFEIDIQYVWNLLLKQDRKCALSGMSLDVKSITNKNRTASLDRIDSENGYVRGNLQWVHKDINRMKRDYADAYFIDICKKIADHRRYK